MQKRTILTAMFVAVLLTAVVSFSLTKQYTAKATIQLSTRAGQEVEVGRIVNMDNYNTQNRPVFLTTQFQLMRSRSVRKLTLERYNAAGFTDLEGNGGVGALAGILDVRSRNNSELVDLTATHTNPKSAAALANAFAQAYMEYNLQAKRDSGSEARQWLSEQIDIHALKIAEASTILREFQSTNNMVDAEEKGTIGEKLSSLNHQIGRIHSARVLQEARLNTLRSRLRASDYAVLAKHLTDIDNSLALKYNNTKADLARLREIRGEKHMTVAEARSGLEILESQIRSEVKQVIRAEQLALDELSHQESELQKQIDGGNEVKLSRLGQLEDYERLKLDLTRSKEIYLRLRARSDELELAARTTLNNVQILDRARKPYKHSFPDIPLFLVLAAFTGLVFGLAIAFAREYLDDTINTPLDVATYLRVPFLGLIPKSDGDAENPIIDAKPHAALSEAIRSIRTVLELRPEGAPHTILVTSAAPSEGKTSTAARLAVSFAQMGKRVLLVDADLRRPRVHSLLEIDRGVGLAELLRGDGELKEASQPTKVDGLWVVTSGQVKGAAKTAERFGETFPALLDTMQDAFDLVILDTPPVQIVSDAAILSRTVDGVVFVARGSTVSRVLIGDSIRLLKTVGANILGVVVNAVDGKRSGSRYYYNYYGYGYGYGQSQYSRYYSDHTDVDDTAQG